MSFSILASVFALFARVLDAIGAICCGVGGFALVMGTLGCASSDTVVGFVANDTLGCALCVAMGGCIVGSSALITLGSANFALSTRSDSSMRAKD